MIRKLSTGRQGFTLIELVLVLAILAVLAGLVIPQVAMLGRSADMAHTAKTQTDVANNLQLFFVLQKRFPQGMDSLITNETTPAFFSPRRSDGSAAANANEQTTGLPRSGPDLWQHLTLGQLPVDTATVQIRRSFVRCGFDYVFDHDITVVNANDSGTTLRGDPVTGFPAGAINVALLTPGSGTAQKLYPPAGAFPNGVGAVVALGVGPRSACIPKTMLQAPVYSGCDGRYYGRYVAFFACYNSGERATLIGVSDSYGRTPDYSIQQYNESLPDGGRQG